MPISTNLTDSEGKVWTFNSGGTPVNSTGTALVIDTTSGDAFDGAFQLIVNGNSIDPQTASLDEGGREVNTVPFNFSDLSVGRSILVSDATISSDGYVRILDSFTNTSQSTVNVTVKVVTNSGADASLQFPFTTNGDTTLTTADYGFVMDDANLTSLDPAVTYAYGDGLGIRPSGTLISGNSADLITLTYSLTLLAGQTQSLLSFVAQSATAAAAMTDMNVMTSSATTLSQNDYLAGLSRDEMLSVVNYSGFDQVTPPFSLTTSDGHVWGIDKQGHLSTIDNGTLAEFAIPIFDQNFTTNASNNIDQKAGEVSITNSGYAASPGATVTYDYKALERQDVIRLLVTVSAPTTAIASFNMESMVSFGPNPLMGIVSTLPFGGSGPAAGYPGGVVLDDSSSGSGGVFPALSYVHGNTGTTATTAIAQSFYSNTSPTESVAAGDTVTYLYFFSVNDSGLQAVGDTRSLMNPTPEQLAGLSDDEVDALRNFDLTAADRLENVAGSDDDNEITGHFWGDHINGGLGEDTLYGGDSDDYLDGDNQSDEVYGDAGDDTLTGGADVYGNLLFGGSGNDVINSAGRGDTAYGGSGNDVLLSTLDYVVFYGGTGNDSLVGTEEADTLHGGQGNDTQRGWDLEDSLSGGKGNDSLDGGIDNDSLYGGVGADSLIGGLGDDLLSGGLHDDLYYIDSTGDVIDETLGNGTADRVLASLSYTLAADDDIEQLTTTSQAGTTVINLTGNDVSQSITGNAAANILTGNGGNDTMTGLAGADTLYGGSGVDSMAGGDDSDWYLVDTATDVVIEGATGGAADRVLASASYTLAANVFVEQLTTALQAGTTAIDLTGNDLAQSITGNDGINVLTGNGSNDTLTALGGTDTLNGGTGTDSMVGGNDSDWYFVDVISDIVVESSTGGSADRVLAAASYTLAAGVYVEQLTTNLQAGLVAMNLTGNELAQSITGNAAANALNGGAANDSLTGLGGADNFVFTTTLGASNVDTITDFVVADDTMQIDNAVFAGLAAGALAGAAFTSNLTGAATAAAHRIIFETDTGALYFDADGTGAVSSAVRFATVTIGTALTVADFFVI